MATGELATAGKRQRRTQRFALRREEIIVAASRVINQTGAQGLTFAAVAKPLGLDTSSIIYYFPTKDALTAACMERTLTELLAIAETAAAAATPEERTRGLIHGYLKFHTRQRTGETPQFAVLSDMRALPDDMRESIDEQYLRLFRTVRGYFEAGQDEQSRVLAHMAAVLLLTNIHWMPGWVDAYDVADFPRVEHQLVRLLVSGLGTEIVSTQSLEETNASEPAQAGFLKAATRLINAHGYRGASVERIAAELGLSTGTFYYHHDNKDDLVVACFERGFGAIREAGRLADDEPGSSGGRRLSQMVTQLVSLQFEPDSPVMRISAYQALPANLRDQMLLETARITRHIAGLISDGAEDGSLPVRDPMIAAQAVFAAVEAAAAMRWWQNRLGTGHQATSFLHLIAGGLSPGRGGPGE